MAMNIHAREFARLHKSLSGQTPLSDLSRLTLDLPDQQGAWVDWSITGSQNTAGQQSLQLAVHAQITLMCQRCLQPFSFTVQHKSDLELVDSEEALGSDDWESLWEEAQQTLNDEHFSDKIVASEQLDVLGLVEDELILSVPYAPKHEVCPGGQRFDAQPDSSPSKPSPFSVLEKLKHR